MDQAEATAAALPASHLEALLSLLCPDGDATARAEAYERARAKLVDVFQWRDLTDPGALADTTLDRVGKKAAEGLVLDRSATAYLLGVAKLVALESGRRAQREVALADPEVIPSPPAEAEVELRASALEGCLAKLGAAERDLVLEYHRGEGRARIEGRQALARRLDTNLVHLRVKVFRLRAKLEQCVKSKLTGDMEPGPATRGVR